MGFGERILGFRADETTFVSSLFIDLNFVLMTLMDVFFFKESDSFELGLALDLLCIVLCAFIFSLLDL